MQGWGRCGREHEGVLSLKKVARVWGAGAQVPALPSGAPESGGFGGTDLEAGRGCWLLASCVTWV